SMARCASAMCCCRYVRRKRATDGTKISTSLSMTKSTVRTRSRAERLRRNGNSETFRPIMMLGMGRRLRSAEARQQAHQPAGALAEQLGREEAAGGALVDL